METKELLLNVLIKKMSEAKIGIIIKNIVQIDYQYIIENLSSRYEKLYISIIGNNFELPQDITNITFADNIEKVVEWRSNPEFAGKILAFLYGESDKMHSLSEFDSITTRDLSYELLEEQIFNSSNEPNKNFWNALKLRITNFSYKYLYDFCCNLTNNDTSIFDNLWRLGLLRDEQILNSKIDVILRIDKNKELISKIGLLSEESRKKLTSTISSSTDHNEKEKMKKTYKFLKDFFKFGKNEILKNLNYDDVEKLLSASKSKKKQVLDSPNLPPSDSIVRKKDLDEIINRLIFSKEEIDIELLKELFEQINKHFSNVNNIDINEDSIIYVNSFTGELEGKRVQLDAFNSDIKKLVSRTCNNDNYGGIIYSHEEKLRDILNERDNNYVPFVPNQCLEPYNYANKSVFEMFDDFDKKIKITYPETNVGFKEVIDELIKNRNTLIDNYEIIMYYPMLAFTQSKEIKEALFKYIESWEQLTIKFCDHQSLMNQISSQCTNYLSRALVSFDTVYINTSNDEWKAVLLPMHPLYLWRYYQILIDLKINNYSDEEDINRYVESLSKLPNLVNFIIVDKMISKSADFPIPNSGLFDMLPIYENKTNRVGGNDGVDYIPNLLNRWISYAPYTANEIRFAIIDSPDLPMSIRMVNKFLTENDMCKKIIIDAYYTDNRTKNPTGELTKMEYDSKDYDISKSINDGNLIIHIKSCHKLNFVAEELQKKPVHIAYFFDQAQYKIDYHASTKQLYISPLVVTYDHEYDEIAEQGIIFPSSQTDSSLIGYYNKILKYSELVNNNLPIPSLNPDLDLSPVNDVIEKKETIWLVVADRTTINYNPKKSISIGEKHFGGRDISIWASEDSRIINQYEQIMKKYNLTPNKDKFKEMLSEFGHIVSEGLICIPKGNNEEVIENKQKGLLGTIFAASWYSKKYTGSLVTSLDSSDARCWLKDSTENEDRADLLGFTYIVEEKTMYVDVIEVKTRDESPDESHATEQVMKMIDVLESIFSDNEFTNLFTNSRREVLKYQIISECFRKIHDKKWQKTWSDLLKDIFGKNDTRPFTIKVRGKILHIKLSDSSIGISSKKIDKSNGKYDIELLKFTAQTIQKEFFDILDLNDIKLIEDLNEESIDNNSLEIYDDYFNSNKIEEQLVNDAVMNSHENNIISNDSKEIPTLLKDNKDQENLIDDIKKMCREFKLACASYKINIEECDYKKAVIGSSVIRLCFTLVRGQSLDALRNNLEDIGREMQHSNLIVQTKLNSRELLLDIPRYDKCPVLFNKVFDDIPNITSPEQLIFTVGETPDGINIFSDLSEITHLLVGGSTGSGKTVLLHTILISLLKNHKNKNEMKLLISSAGYEDFTYFENLPHLIGNKIITSPTETVEMIKTVVNDEFERRATILSNGHVPNIKEYNAKYSEKLAPIVIIIDEFADITDQFTNNKDKNDFFDTVGRIAQIGRKRGIHLIICTQRPSANLVPSRIKSQLNGRIALKVNDATSSRMIIEETGAQFLQKHGDLIYSNSAEKIRAQGYYITIDEIEDFVKSVIQFTS